MIVIEKLGKAFRSQDGTETIALDNISLKIREHEIVSIVGPSGCGKSSLLRIIGGLMTATTGTISTAGVPVVAPRRDTGVVFQAPTLLPWYTIIENVLFPAQAINQMDDEKRNRASELLELVGLKGFENKYPRELSGGMQQRAGICRALILEPSVLLMDEPFSALDALTREEMVLELLRIWQNSPKTVVFVTHSISEAIMLSDRIVVMSPRPGRIVEIVDVDLPRPRGFHLEESREFQVCAQKIRGLIFNNRAQTQVAHV